MPTVGAAARPVPEKTASHARLGAASREPDDRVLRATCTYAFQPRERRTIGGFVGDDDHVDPVATGNRFPSAPARRPLGEQLVVLASLGRRTDPFIDTGPPDARPVVLCPRSVVGD